MILVLTRQLSIMMPYICKYCQQDNVASSKGVTPYPWAQLPLAIPPERKIFLSFLSLSNFPFVQRVSCVLLIDKTVEHLNIRCHTLGITSTFNIKLGHLIHKGQCLCVCSLRNPNGWTDWDEIWHGGGP